jgi:hypothetical protein
MAWAAAVEGLTFSGRLTDRKQTGAAAKGNRTLVDRGPRESSLKRGTSGRDFDRPENPQSNRPMKPRNTFVVAAFAAFLLIARLGPSEAPGQATAALQGDAGHPGAARWLRSELYFGVGSADLADGGVGEMRWRAFLDKEVTSRFPDGLTVFEAYGQWRDRGDAAPSRLRSKVLVILHEDTPANRASIDAIRIAWKAATHDQSVLLATEQVEVSF